MNILNKDYLKFRVCFCCVLLFFYQTIYASEFVYHLSSAQWAVPRSASSILSMEAVTSAMRVIRVNENSSLVIHHPGGDEGSLWALELRGWLISLGLPATKISLSPGSTDTKQLDLEIIIDRESSIITDK
ncbi:MAG: hypothetical protein ACC657_00150 [Thiohalomonadales bacterium]